MINKNHNVSKTSFLTMIRLTSGVDCQSSYSLLLFWCRGTNDWWISSCLHSLQQPSPTSKHFQIIHVGWVKLLCLVHCLKGSFEKATAPPQSENNIQIQKSTLHNRFGPIFSLKILGIFVLTAHIGFRWYVKIAWWKPFHPAFWLFTLTWWTHSFFSLI